MITLFILLLIKYVEFLLPSSTIALFIPSADVEWEAEVRGFLENYEFPCVGAWDGFHVYINSKLKFFFSFKK